MSKTEMHENENGTKMWMCDGKRHREDGPAIEFPGGGKHWFSNGKRHRVGGPAIEHPCGKNECCGKKEWWEDGVFQYSEEPIVDVQAIKSDKKKKGRPGLWFAIMLILGAAAVAMMMGVFNR